MLLCAFCFIFIIYLFNNFSTSTIKSLAFLSPLQLELIFFPAMANYLREQPVTETSKPLNDPAGPWMDRQKRGVEGPAGSCQALLWEWIKTVCLSGGCTGPKLFSSVCWRVSSYCSFRFSKSQQQNRPVTTMQTNMTAKTVENFQNYWLIDF